MLDLGIDLDVWPWICLIVAVAFALIELTLLGGSFVLLPFAASAFVAALLAFYDAAVEVQWAVFVFGGALAFWAFARWARHHLLERLPIGVGADRLVGMAGTVIVAIVPGDTSRAGRVALDGEPWGAITDGTATIPARARVRVVEMRGTRVVVEQIGTGTTPQRSTHHSTRGNAMNVVAVIIAALFVVGIAFLIGAVKIVRPYQRGLVERLGRYRATKEPGFNLIMPFVERMQLVDMREQVVDVPPQEVITEDNVVVSVDAVVYYEATDPQRLIYNVADFFTAITKLAQTNLRNLIGDLELDKALTSRDRINTQLREVLDDATDKWGVRVVRVEIQRIDPPPEVVSAMHAQMRAERDRRATVTEARGFQEAAIAHADGEKQSSILAAEGRRQAAILDAEGEAQAIALRAAAERQRLELIGEGEGRAARARLTGIKAADADRNVLVIEYLTALERIGDGRATKLVIPAEFSGLLGAVSALTAATQTDGDDGEIRPRHGLSIPDPGARVEVPPPGGGGR